LAADHGRGYRGGRGDGLQRRAVRGGGWGARQFVAQAKSAEQSKVDIEVEDSEVLQDAIANDQIVVSRPDGVRAVFTRDERGALKLCMEASPSRRRSSSASARSSSSASPSSSSTTSVVTELKQRNMTIVDESVSPTDREDPRNGICDANK